MANIVVGLNDAKPAPSVGLAQHLCPSTDNHPRCAWGASTLDYASYHDNEWAVPTDNDVQVLERLCLEGFQAGLSWLTILRKRDRFREVFHGFDPDTVAGFTESDVELLVGDPGIIRHRGKIEATINNARLVVEMQHRGESLAGLIWSYEEPDSTTPESLRDVASQTSQSQKLSKDLRKRGFRFVGPTTAYAAMQAIGVVDDHLGQCWVRSARESDRSNFVRPNLIR